MSVNIYNSNPNATSEEENFSCVADRGSKLASDTIYSNTTSGLNSVNVQGAIDEVNEKVDDNADAISQINSDLSDMYKLVTYQQSINGNVGLQYVDITKQHNGICVMLGYSGTVADTYITDCSIRANGNSIRLNLSQAETVIVTIAEFYQ